MDTNYLAEIVDHNVNSKMDLSKEYSDSELKKLINESISLLDNRLPLTEDVKKLLLFKVFNGKRKLGIIQPLLEDITVNEIMINGTNNIYDTDKITILVNISLFFEIAKSIIFCINTAK